MLVLQINSGGAVDVDVDSLVRDVERVEGARHRLGRSVGRRRAGRGDPAGGGVGGRVGLERFEHRPGRRRCRSTHPATRPRPRCGASSGRSRSATGATRPARRRLTTEKLSADDARRAGAIDRVAPTVGELIVSLDGREVVSGGETRTLDTAKVIGDGRGPAAAAEPGGALHPPRPRRAAAAHAGQPVDRLPALRGGPGTDRVRVLHVRDRPRRARRRGGDDLWARRLLPPPRPLVGDRAPDAVGVRVRRRRAGGRPGRVDRSSARWHWSQVRSRSTAARRA